MLVTVVTSSDQKGFHSCELLLETVVRSKIKHLSYNLLQTVCGLLINKLVFTVDILYFLPFDSAK